MAISNNMLLKLLSGQLNKQIVIKQYGDKTVMSTYPDMSRRILSPKQKQNLVKMQEANYAVRKIMANEELASAAQVRLNVTRNKLYTALIKEYFKSHKEAESKADL